MKCHSIHKIIVLVLSVFSHFLTAQNKGEFVVPLTNPNSIGRLDVNIKKGTVRVNGSNRKDILIKYSKIEKTDKNAEYESKVEAASKTEKIPDGMKKIGESKIALEIKEKDNTIWIKNSKLSNNLNIEIEIPYSFNVVVKTYLGDGISISNVTGEMNLESDLGGYVKAENITGIINASTYSGDVTVTFKDIPKPTDMIFRNYSGNIDISLPATYKSNLKLKTSEGEIFSLLDFEVYTNEVELQKETSEGSFRAYTDSWTYAKLNGGGPEIKVSSELGNIYFRSKQ